jgi:pimeloyl-ACP methyl ester carboxylesterase
MNRMRSELAAKRAGEPAIHGPEQRSLGERISVKGRQFAYEVIGTGSPTIVLETGIGAESSEWQLVATALARSRAVFGYDRAGRGESDPGQGDRDALTMVGELNALLEATQTKGPYLLVGHSFGGLLMRLFAAAKHASVDGLVLVESVHPRQFQMLGPAFPASSPSEVPALVQMRDFWTGGWRAANSTREHVDFERSFAQDRSVTSLGNLPLCVVSAASFLNTPFIPDAAARQRMQQLWNELQAELSRLSDNHRTVYLEKSGHFVQRDDPDSIVMAIEALLRDRHA